MGLSERTVRGLLKQGLPHVRMPSGTVLAQYEKVDAFLEQWEVKSHEVDEIANGMMEGLNG